MLLAPEDFLTASRMVAEGTDLLAERRPPFWRRRKAS